MNFVNARKMEETRGWRLEERATGWQSQFSSRIYVHICMCINEQMHIK